MHIVTENRNVIRISCSQLLFISALCIIAVYVIFVTASEKDTKFNTKYNEDKSVHRLDDDIMETIYRHKRAAIKKPYKNVYKDLSPIKKSKFDLFGFFHGDIVTNQYFLLLLVAVILISIAFYYCYRICNRQTMKTDWTEN